MKMKCGCLYARTMFKLGTKYMHITTIGETGLNPDRKTVKYKYLLTAYHLKALEEIKENYRAGDANRTLEVMNLFMESDEG